MLLTVESGPSNLGRALALVEERLAFLLHKEELLAVDTDEDHTPAGVDLKAAKAAVLGPVVTKGWGEMG